MQSPLLPRLGVNIDHVATLRNARGTPYPSPVHAAVVSELGGADQITVHLRQDERHIRENDVHLLRKTIGTRLNLEMAALPEMLSRAFEIKPDMVTLVPERREEITTEGGLDVSAQKDMLKRYVSDLKNADIHVSLFIDPNLEQIQMAHRVGADAIEIHTGAFCDAKNEQERESEYIRLVQAAKGCVKTKMRCYAGHGIHYQNVGAVAGITEIEELNIGHAIVGRAVFTGLEAAVREMKSLMQNARRDAIASR